MQKKHAITLKEHTHIKLSGRNSCKHYGNVLERIAEVHHHDDVQLHIDAPDKIIPLSGNSTTTKKKSPRHLQVYSKTKQAYEAGKPPTQGTSDGEVLWGLARFLKVRL